jgi:hypothetical protein
MIAFTNTDTIAAVKAKLAKLDLRDDQLISAQEDVLETTSQRFLVLYLKQFPESDLVVINTLNEQQVIVWISEKMKTLPPEHSLEDLLENTLSNYVNYMSK